MSRWGPSIEAMTLAKKYSTYEDYLNDQAGIHTDLVTSVSLQEFVNARAFLLTGEVPKHNADIFWVNSILITLGLGFAALSRVR